MISIELTSRKVALIVYLAHSGRQVFSIFKIESSIKLRMLQFRSSRKCQDWSYRRAADTHRRKRNCFKGKDILKSSQWLLTVIDSKHLHDRPATNFLSLESCNQPKPPDNRRVWERN